MLHVKVQRDALMKAAASANSVASKKPTIAILANVLLEAEGGVLAVTASDLEITSQLRLPAEVFEPGRVTVPAKIFNDIVRNVANDNIVLQETANHSVILTSGSFSVTLFGLAPESFPTLAPIEGAVTIPLESASLSDAIAKTVSSVSFVDDTYNLSGVYFLREAPEDEPARMRLISTDTQRLNVATLNDNGFELLEMATAGVLVSVKGLQELKSITDGSAKVEFGVLGDKLVAKTEDAVVLARLMDGPFPDYRRVLPEDNDLGAWFFRKDLLDALKRVKLVVTSRSSVAKFEIAGSVLTITASNPELGKAEETVGADYSGPDVVTGFNPDFFIDILSSMASEKILLSMKEGKVSYLVTGPEDPGFYAVVVSSSLSE